MRKFTLTVVLALASILGMQILAQPALSAAPDFWDGTHSAQSAYSVIGGPATNATGYVAATDASGQRVRAADPAWQPAGHFETSFRPQGDQLVLAGAGAMLLAGDQLNMSQDGGHMWQALATHIYWAPISTVAASPAFDEDGALFLAIDYGDPLWLSSTGGYNWHKPQQNVPSPVIEIAVSPIFDQDHTVFVVTGRQTQGKLLRSVDGGEHWENLSVPESALPRGVELSPSFGTDQTLFLWMSDGSVLRSSNRGATWSPASEGLGIPSGNRVQYLTISPAFGNDKTLFAATLTGVYETYDRGQSWHKVSGTVLAKLVLAPDYPQSRLLFGIAYETSGAGNKYSLWRSLNRGRTWQVVWSESPWPWCPGTMSVTISPRFSHDHTVYLAGGCSGVFLISRDEGVTWEAVSSSSLGASSESEHQFENIVVSPGFEDDGVVFVYSGADSYRWFVYRSEDGGGSWTTLQLPMTGPLQVAISPGYLQDQTVFLAVTSSLYRSTNGGNQWQLVTSHLPFSVSGDIEYDKLMLSPNYENDHTLFISGQSSGIFRSTDNGATWQRFASRFLSVRDFEISSDYPHDPTMFVVAERVYRSDDRGLTWASLATPDTMYHLELSPSFDQDHTLFVGTCCSNGSVWRSIDRGNSWNNITGNMLASAVSGIAVSPRYATDQTLIVAPEDRPLYISEDGGNTWFAMKGIPQVGRYRGKYGLAIAYQNGLLQPIASEPSGGIYRYRWPKLPVESVSVGVEPGTQPLLTVQLPLQPDDFAPVPWFVETGSNWPLVEPMQGILPASLTLAIDVANVGTPAATEMHLTVRWSEQQAQVIAIPVHLWEIGARQYFPLAYVDH